MDKDYLQQFSDENIRRVLLRTENIPLLEDLLAKEIALGEKLQKQKLNLGSIPATNDLPALLEEVKPHVDDFLGVAEIEVPNIGYKCDYDAYLSSQNKYRCTSLGFVAFSLASLLAIPVLSIGLMEYAQPLAIGFLGSITIPSLGFGFYNGIKFVKNENSFTKENSGTSYYSKNAIFLRVKEKKRLINHLAHEYTHHVQKEKGISYQNYQYFCEGQAQAVGGYIDTKYCLMENDPAFLLQSLEDDVGSLKATYIWLAEKLQKRPNRSLLVPTAYENYNLTRLKERGRPTKHAISTAFFSLLEAREGTGIHKEIMAGRY